MKFDVEKFRKDCKISDTKRDAGLTTPDNILRYNDISYGKYGKYNLLDIYHQKEVTAPQKTIIDIHGGGWTYGDKDVYQYYCMDLAQRGFTVVNFSYRLAPENPFPAALEDINTVFIWVAENACTYHIDLDKICVTGDSAGAQLASQYLTLLCSAEYRKLFSMQVPFDKIAVKAVALNCGRYDMNYCLENKIDDPFLTYIDKALSEDRELTLERINAIKYINKNFPPAYIMTSEYDFLKEDAKPMYDLLHQKGISCMYKLYGKEGDDYMGHVFHLNLRLEEARVCNDEECSFLTELCSDGFRFSTDP